MSPRARSAIGAAALAVGALVVFAGFMQERLAAVVVGSPILLLGLVLVGLAFRQVGREIHAAQARSENALREAIAEKRDGNAPKPPL